jgi:hypothetical protein
MTKAHCEAGTYIGGAARLNFAYSEGAELPVFQEPDGGAVVMAWPVHHGTRLQIERGYDFSEKGSP